MIESPLIQELLAKQVHKDILRVLNTRFGKIPPEIATGLETIQDGKKLDKLLQWAVKCPDAQSFQQWLQS